MPIEHINKTDTLNEGREKINEAIDGANAADVTSKAADTKATQALANSESTQTQLDTIVIDGDSSVEAAQARVDEKGVPHPTLKARIDDGFEKTSQQLAEIVKQKESISIENFISDDLTIEESFIMALGYVEENEVSLYIPSEDFTLDNWTPYKASKPIKIIGSEVGESRIINNGESIHFIESDTSGVYRFVTFENFYSIHFMSQEKDYIPYVVFDNCFFVAGSNKHENGITLGGVSWNDGKDGVSIG